MVTLILNEFELYEIRPSDFPEGIKGKDLKAAFNKESWMKAAAAIIRSCQKGNLWRRFRVDSFPNNVVGGIEELIKEGLLIERGGWVKPTSEFVDRCCAAVSD